METAWLLQEWLGGMWKTARPGTQNNRAICLQTWETWSETGPVYHLSVVLLCYIHLISQDNGKNLTISWIWCTSWIQLLKDDKDWSWEAQDDPWIMLSLKGWQELGGGVIPKWAILKWVIQLSPCSDMLQKSGRSQKFNQHVIRSWRKKILLQVSNKLLLLVSEPWPKPCSISGGAHK